VISLDKSYWLKLNGHKSIITKSGRFTFRIHVDYVLKQFPLLIPQFSCYYFPSRRNDRLSPLSWLVVRQDLIYGAHEFYQTSKKKKEEKEKGFNIHLYVTPHLKFRLNQKPKIYCGPS